MDCSKPIIGGCGMPPNFAEKTFAGGSQTLKSAKVFSLESFLLYGRMRDRERLIFFPFRLVQRL